MIQDSNNNVMTAYDRVNGKMNNLQASETKDLQTSEDALTKLEQLSNQQGSGQITLFFAEGSSTIDPTQSQRLIGFLDYISRDAHGRKVILVSLGSASSVGNAAQNKKLSIERGDAPLPIINQYLVNIPTKCSKSLAAATWLRRNAQVRRSTPAIRVCRSSPRTMSPT